MDYKIMYEQAIKRAKAMISVAANQEEVYNGVITIFPELAESENDKIRKAILEHIKGIKSWEYFLGISKEQMIDWLEKQGEQKPNPYSGTSFEYNGHTWGMCARDGGVEVLIDGHIKGRVFTNDSNAKEMFIKALERVEEQNSKGYKLTDCDKNTWWEDFKAYTSCTIEQKPAWSEDDEVKMKELISYLIKKKSRETDGYAIFLKSLKFRLLSPFMREFDKEEGSIIDHLIAICDDAMCYKTFAGCYDIEKCKRFLTNLKFGIDPQPETTWKPSDEEMKVLDVAIKNSHLTTAEYNGLVKLREQLKKL